MSVSFMSRREFNDALQTPQQSETIFVTAANGYTMNANLALEVYQTKVELGTLTGNIIVYLPSVAKAKGRTYRISMTNSAYQATVQTRGQYTTLDTSVAHDDAFNWDGDYILTGTDAYLSIMSDGVSWIEISKVL